MPSYEARVTYRIYTDYERADEDEIADALYQELGGTVTIFVEETDEEPEYGCQADVWGGIEIRELETK